MRVFLAVLFGIFFSTSLLADGHGVLPPTGNPADDFEQTRWVDPATARYRITWEIARVNIAADGSETVVPCAMGCSQFADQNYATAIVSSGLLGELHKQISARWAVEVFDPDGDGEAAGIMGRVAVGGLQQ